jgi:glycosyltransferase involved in cell wall biosynthesis
MLISAADFVFWTIAAVHFGMALRAFIHLRWVRRLPAVTSLSANRSQMAARVSVVLAARDEEARIQGTIRRLLAQKGVEVEVIAVDDRSTDRTGEILRLLATEDPRLKVLRVDALPADWLGKCHACHLGAGAATGDWILFTDADCWLKEDVIARALIVADRERADHVTLTPGVAPEGIGAQAWHLSFLVTICDWVAGVNRDKPKAYLGIGAFNLVKASAYRECGGYEALRLTVLDDVRMGLLLRRAGKRTRAFVGGDDAECHWGTTVRSMIKIMEKNYFAAVDYRFGLIGGLVTFGAILWGGAFTGLFMGTLAGFAAFVAMLLVTVPGAVLASRLRWRLAASLLTPFVFPLLFYAMLNSALVTRRQGGIRWRDTFYSLELLRQRTVR